MLYGFVMCVHIVVSLGLIGVILLQAGKGGLAESFGGGAAQSVLGTSAGSFLTKATTTCAIMFMVTCISLTLLSSRRGGSLLRGIVPAHTSPIPTAPDAIPEAPTSPFDAPADEHEETPVFDESVDQ